MTFQSIGHSTITTVSGFFCIFVDLGIVFTFVLVQTRRAGILNLTILKLKFYISFVWGYSYYQTTNTELVSLLNLKEGVILNLW